MQAALRKVEAAVHPLVAEERVRWLGALATRGEPLALLDVPLLYETGLEADVRACPRLLEDLPWHEMQRRRCAVACGSATPLCRMLCMSHLACMRLDI